MPDNPAERALAVATEYVHAYFRQFPEEAYEYGYPGAPEDRLSDRSPEALAEWHALEDAWLAELSAIPCSALEGTAAALPCAYVRERLEASAERRVSSPELWNVSVAWGWPTVLTSTFARQPVGNAAARAEALARARDVPRYLDVEIENLRQGLRRGLVGTAANVDAVLEQADALLAAAPEASPVFDPALRDGDPAFTAYLRAVITNEVHPALLRYRAFLADEYRPAARPDGAGQPMPGGAAGYRASVRFWASVAPDPEAIQALGRQELERVLGEMRELAAGRFGGADVGQVLTRLRTDPRYTFDSADAVMACAQSAVARARAALPGWFGRSPQAEVEVRAFPAFQKRSGGGLYFAAGAGRPATYELGTWAPREISRAGLEATAFHETYPGHHLQIATAQENPDLHPALRYLGSAGFAEGWALYAERLADEMGLYTTAVDRMGLLSNEALRAVRLVVDPGLNALGWSRARAIRYMLDHTAESEVAVTYEVDRYLAGPGQATSYLLGCLELRRLRQLAEARLGSRFDLRAFHDHLLEHGAIALSTLAERTRSWLDAGGA